MTTTHMYSGMDPGTKPTSRVLAPPGGRSQVFGDPEDAQKPRVIRKQHESDIFGEGTGDETPSPQRNTRTFVSNDPLQQMAEPMVRAKAPQTNTHSNLFGDNVQEVTEKRILNKPKVQATSSVSEDSVADPKSALQERRATVKKMTQCTYNPITCETLDGFVDEQWTPSKRLSRVEATGNYNPITGQSYENEEEEGKGDVPTTKVKHPPGGASTGLW